MYLYAQLLAMNIHILLDFFAFNLQQLLLFLSLLIVELVDSRSSNELLVQHIHSSFQIANTFVHGLLCVLKIVLHLLEVVWMMNRVLKLEPSI